MSGDDGLSYCCVKREPSSEEDDPDTSYAQSFYSKSVETLGPLETLAPAAPAAVPVSGSAEPRAAATFATLEAAPARQQTSSSLLERHRSLSVASCGSQEEYMFAIKDEPVSDEHPGSDDPGPPSPTGDRKSWTAQDMDQALQALKSRAMSLTKASATYGIPSTSLWQRAHRLGIDTPKKEGNTKSWGDADLRRALHALRTGAISANKASKAYGIPSSTLYKIARREGIRLAAPFNAAPTSWQRDELRQALEAIRCGAASVQCAAVQFGIPTGTLYGRCKREGIELSRSNPTPWSEHAMGEALESVRVGQMSINQAAIHYNLPYSSLYGRFKRIKEVNQPQDYAESQPPESGANQPSHTHPEIAFLNQSIQESPQRDQLHPPALQLHTDQGLGSPAQSSQRLDEGLNPPTYVLVGQGLQPIDEGLRSPTYHLSGQGFSPQGLHRVEAGLTSPTHALDRGLTPQGLLNDQVLNSPVPSRSSPMLNLTQLHASPNQRSQSAIKLEASPDQVEPGLRSPMQVNQTLQSPVQEQDHKTMNLLTPGPGDANQVSLQPNLDPQSLNSPVPSFPASPPINPGLNPPAPYQGLQTLHPYLFSQYSDQYPTEYSLYYQSCNGLAS